MSSLLALLVLIAPASATDVGRSKRWGVGLEFGAPNALTGKFFFDEMQGVSLHAGWWATLALSTRAQYEREFIELGDWGAARMGLYWLAGMSFGYLPYHPYYGAGYVGPHGGAAAEFQFHDLPMNLYLEANVGASLAFASPVTKVWPVANAQLGGRWHF